MYTAFMSVPIIVSMDAFPFGWSIIQHEPGCLNPYIRQMKLWRWVCNACESVFVSYILSLVVCFVPSVLYSSVSYILSFTLYFVPSVVYSFVSYLLSFTRLFRAFCRLLICFVPSVLYSFVSYLLLFTRLFRTFCRLLVCFSNWRECANMFNHQHYIMSSCHLVLDICAFHPIFLFFTNVFTLHVYSTMGTVVFLSGLP